MPSIEHEHDAFPPQIGEGRALSGTRLEGEVRSDVADRDSSGVDRSEVEAVGGPKIRRSGARHVEARGETRDDQKQDREAFHGPGS